MLLAVPLLVAVMVGFSGGIGTLPFGISSLANGPSIESAGVPGGSTPTQNLSGLVTPAGAAGVAGAAGGGAGAVGVGGAELGSGTAATPGVNPVPTAPAGTGGKRQPGEGDAAPGGGGGPATAPATAPVNPPADPGDVTGDPAGSVNNVVGQLEDAVGGLVDPQP
jgi:hypothetical protein